MQISTDEATKEGFWCVDTIRFTRVFFAGPNKQIPNHQTDESNVVLPKWRVYILEGNIQRFPFMFLLFTGF